MKIEHITAQALNSPGLHYAADVVVAMPAIDMIQAYRSAELMARRCGGLENACLLLVEDTEREGYVAVCNRAFRASQSQYFAYVAQDAFAGRGWLRIALNHMQKTGKSMLAFNDGKWSGSLAGFGLVERQWAQAHYMGDIFFPDYKQHFADAELTHLARNSDQLCYTPRSVLIEVDWDKDRKKSNGLDKKLFESRLNLSC